MEVKEAERVVVAKPVASRPTTSTFRSFSELLAGAIDTSPPSNTCSDSVVAAIRPKTARVKPITNQAHVASVSSRSQPDVSGVAAGHSDNALKTDSRPVVYKPLAKLVSKTTISLLANLGNLNVSHQQALAQVEARSQHLGQDRPQFRSHISSNHHQDFPSRTESDQMVEHSMAATASQNHEEDQKSIPITANGDRTSYDGYNWRKYGQKQVKGSEYPRSYYKCTHPNCPVKKKVERSFDGQIAEIVYKGEHNHSKPQPAKRSSSSTQGQGLVSDGTGRGMNAPVSNNQLNNRTEGSEGRLDDQNEVGLSNQISYPGKVPLAGDPVATRALNTGVGTCENSCGLSAECEEGSKEIEEEEPRSKRRKCDSQSTEVGVQGEGSQEPHIAVQSSTDSEIIGDGFRWRKYGQKVVKGNPYPRCTNLHCNVRKYVERASDDPRAFITTYEGKHNHDVPSPSTKPAASEPDSQAHTSKDKP
ncbi:WRKY domain [Dillenia turbinata]|uniref:WRKY domain n=1 Tax=Dillenia turbinata TaxID=194707 RepID=A0AAN8W8P1_9MAGN